MDYDHWAGLPMLFVALAMSLASFATALVGFAVVARGAWCEIAWLRVTARTAGLPTLRTRHLVANHLRSFVLAPANSALARDTHRELAATTFGWMTGTQFAASTIDLDLIGQLVKLEERAPLVAGGACLAAPLDTGRGLMWAGSGEQWRKMRAVCAEALSCGRDAAQTSASARQQAQSSAEKLVGLVELHLGRGATQRRSTLVALDELLHRFTLDALLACLFNQDQRVNFDHEPCEWTAQIKGALDRSVCPRGRSKLALAALPGVLLELVDSLVQLASAACPARSWISGQLKALTAANIQNRQRHRPPPLAGGDHDQSVVSLLTDAHLEGRLTRRQYAQCLGPLVGTADTSTRSCLVAAIYLLATHEQEQEKLRESVAREGALGSERLAGVLNESLRLLPPVPFCCARKLARDTRLKSGHILPAGTQVHVSTFALHRCEQLWGPDAAEFRPERWMAGAARKIHPHQFLPFGAGPRQCPGSQLALIQMKTLLATLLKRYKFEAKVKWDLEKFASPLQHFSVPNSPTYVTISRR